LSTISFFDNFESLGEFQDRPYLKKQAADFALETNYFGHYFQVLQVPEQDRVVRWRCRAIGASRLLPSHAWTVSGGWKDLLRRRGGKAKCQVDHLTRKSGKHPDWTQWRHRVSLGCWESRRTEPLLHPFAHWHEM